MIIDGIEYEDEPGFTDPETGKPVYYAKNVPEQIRLTSALTEEDLKRAAAFEKLHPNKRLEKGATEWNHWVKTKENKWSLVHEKADLIHICRKTRNELNGFNIVFGDASNNIIKCSELEKIVFPCAVYFENCQFLGNGRWDYISCFDDFCFKHCEFKDNIRFVYAQFSGQVLFKDVVFTKHVEFFGSHFSKRLSFDNCSFNKSLICDSVKYFETLDFHEVTFGSSISFRDIYSKKSLSITAGKLPHFYSDKCNYLGGLYWRVNEVSGDFKLKECLLSEIAFQGKTVFHENFELIESTCFGSMDFSDCKFQGYANFLKLQTCSSVDFRNSCFKGFVGVDHAWFGKSENTPKPTQYQYWDETLQLKYDSLKTSDESFTVPDFRGAIFEVAPNLGYTNVPDIPAPKWVWAWIKQKLMDRLLSRFWQQNVPDQNNMPPYAIKDGAAAAKLRVLGALAARGHHHLAEKRFFRAELLARRGWETKNGYEVAMINAFEKLSKCGLSFWWPMRWLVGVVAVSALFYASQIDWPAGDSGLFELTSYSIANSLPLLGYISDSYEVSVNVLFDGIDKVPGCVRVWAFVQNAVSAILIFFGLLAIRNYFKLG